MSGPQRVLIDALQGNASGTILNNPVTTSGNTITFTSAPVLPGTISINWPNYMPLVLEPNTPQAEVVWLTNWTAGATTGTIWRNAEPTANGQNSSAEHTSVAWAHAPTVYDAYDSVRQAAYQDILDQPGRGGASVVSVGQPTAFAGSTRSPIIDAVLGDSIPYGTGASPGVTDWATVMSRLECRHAGLADPGPGWRSAYRWADVAQGVAPAAITQTSVSLTNGTNPTITVTSTTGMVPGMAVTVTAGTGTLSAGATVGSIASNTTFVLNGSVTSAGTITGNTLSFAATLLLGVGPSGTATALKITSAQALGDGVTRAGAAITVASVTTTAGANTATVASGGFPNVVGGMIVAGTGVPLGTQVYGTSGNTITFDRNLNASGTVTLTFTMAFRRVQIYYAKINNGDNVTFVANSTSSGSLSTHSTTGGIGVWDSGDSMTSITNAALGSTGITATGGTATSGSGGGGVIILGVRYLINNPAGAQVDNFAYPATFGSSWSVSSSGGVNLQWVQMIQSMALAGTPYRRVFIAFGINDASLYATPANIYSYYVLCAQAVAAVSPTTEVVMMVTNYGDGLTEFDNCTINNASNQLTNAGFAGGVIPTPTLGSTITFATTGQQALVQSVTGTTATLTTLTGGAFSYSGSNTTTATVYQTIQRQGPKYWLQVAQYIERAARDTASSFFNCYELFGDVSPQAQVPSVTTVINTNQVTVSSGGFPGAAVGQLCAGTGIGQQAIVLGISGNTLTLSANCTASGTVTLTFFNDVNGFTNYVLGSGIYSGGLHVGDYSTSLSGRDAHYAWGEAAYFRLANSRNLNSPYSVRTPNAQEGAVKFRMPQGLPGFGPSIQGFVNANDQIPTFALQAGFLQGPGLYLGPGGSTAFDTTLVRTAAGLISVTTNLVIVNQTVTVTAGACTIPVANGSSKITVVATTAITMATSGAVDGQLAWISIYDNGTGQTLSWVNTENSTVSAPLTSGASTTLPKTVLLRYNASTSKWRILLSV